jgi:hypothetical protein
VADDDECPTLAPAPLPRHERSWRHPSEIGQQRRATARRPAPPLTARTIFPLTVLGLGVIAALVLLVMPREAPREMRPQIRNAAAATLLPVPVGKSPPIGFMTIDGDRFVLAIDTPRGTRFVTTGIETDVVVILGDDRVRLESALVDTALGLSVLQTAQTLGFAHTVVRAPDDSPAVGTSVVIRGITDVTASIGISVLADTTTFVPLSGDALGFDVVAASPVEDSSGRLLGLFTERSGAKGYVPVGAIDNLLSRSH